MSASARAPFGTHGAQSSPDEARSTRWATSPRRHQARSRAASADEHSLAPDSSEARCRGEPTATVSSRERLTSSSQTRRASIGIQSASRRAMVPVDCRISMWRHASRQTAKRRLLTLPVAIGREYITGYLVYGTDFPSLLVELARALRPKPLRNRTLRAWPGDRIPLWM